jgi:beta-barrel assembly-enhancing protease
MTVELNRRALLTAGGALSAGLFVGSAEARIAPASLKPLVGPGYKPVDPDEKGMWQQMERVEEEISGSNLLIRDPRLTGYLKNLIGKVGGPAARDMRIYLARIPEFNAVMFPTGFAVIFSGLLLRMRDEAQLAGVIAHEGSHFLLKHQLRMWRDMRKRTDILSFLAMGAGIGGAGAGFYAGDLVQLAQLGTILSMLRYNRQLEAEADALGLKLIAEAGYAPISMSQTWEQLIGEIELSAKYRRKRPNRGYSIFSTHPAPKARMLDLRASAQELTVPGKAYETGRGRYLSTLAPIRQMLVEDQVKLNDPGASQYVVNTLARDGWNGLLRYGEAEIWRLRGKNADMQRAAAGYAAAVAYADAPAEAWRWHGVFLSKAGRQPEARAALSRYLAMRPNAPDAAFVRQMIGQAEAAR